MADEDPKCWHRYRSTEEDYNQLQKSAFTKWINKCLAEVGRRNSRSFSREGSLQLLRAQLMHTLHVEWLIGWCMNETPLCRIARA